MAFTKKVKAIAPPVEETPIEQAPESNHAPGTSLAPMDLGQLGQTIGNAVAAGMAQNAPPRKLSIGDYIRRGGINQYHPDPKKEVKMTREYYQNGRLITHDTVFDREVELLNEISHSGRYIDRLVEVVVAQNGSEEAVDIRYSNKRDKAFELKGKCRNFQDMLEQIVAVQRAERQELEEEKADRLERKRVRQSTFGNSKASREARERAGV